MLQPVAQFLEAAAPEPHRRAAAVDLHLHLVDQILGAADSRQILSAAEWEHARQITHAGARQAYVAGRCLLRQTLSQAVDGVTAPAAWRLTEGPHGKPALAAGHPRLHFNLSHAGDAVAMAVSRGEVGIDLEACDPAALPLPEILCARERTRLAPAAPGCPAGFLELWCAKEAAAKALGLGCSLDFRQLQVDPARGEVYLCTGSLDPPPRITFRSFRARLNGRAYCLAVAVLH